MSRLTAPRQAASEPARAPARIRAPLSPLSRSDYTFVLVTGSMRSGTTLMGELLYSRASRWPRHPTLSFDNDEIGTFRLLSRRLRSRTNIEAECPSIPIPLDLGIIDGMFTTAREAGPADPERVLDEFARRLAGQIIDLAPTPRTPTVVGMKMTHLLAEWDLLKALYPRHRMIVMVRDPRDVLASLKSRADMRESAGSSHAILATMLSYHAFLRARADDADIKVIRYEDLVNDTEPVLRDVLDFLALDPETYDWQALRRGDVAENSTYGQGKGETLVKGRGVVKTSIGAFRRRLPPAEVRLVDKLLAEQMRDYGYAPEHSDAGAALNDQELATLFELRRTAMRMEVSLDALDARLRAMAGSGDRAG